MRVFVALFGLVGCFSPHPPDLGTPDPTPGDGLLAGDAPAVDPDAPALDADLRTHFEYPATVAECVNPNNPDTALCRSRNQGNLMQMVVDGRDSTFLNPWVAFIRFDLDNAISGKTITTIELRVMATDDPKADGPSSGELWIVDPFTLASLDDTTPGQITQLAGSQGAVSENEIVNFPVTTASVTAGSPVYFGIFPTVNEGTNYWNSSGPNPPRLIIDTQ